MALCEFIPRFSLFGFSNARWIYLGQLVLSILSSSLVLAATKTKLDSARLITPVTGMLFSIIGMCYAIAMIIALPLIDLCEPHPPVFDEYGNIVYTQVVIGDSLIGFGVGSALITSVRYAVV